MSLFRLPRVASTASPKAAARMLASISLLVVLPLLPVTASSGRSKRARQAAASAPSARRVSATANSGRPLAATAATAGWLRASSATSAATAPRSRAVARNSCASYFTPRRAMNSSPARTLRVSVETPMKAALSPTRRPCTAAAAPLRSSWMVMPASPGARRARPQPRPDQRRAGARRRFPGTARAPCQRAG